MPSLALVVLDGFGLAPDGPGNAVSQADTPIFDELWAGYPHTTLSTSGRDVGLPDGQMGNSEVGHLNLGAGAVVKQDLARIDDAIADGSFFENPALRAACGSARESRRGRLHAIGLISDGGVHSGWEHIEAVIELAGEEGVSDLVLHALTDGRDTLPHNGAGYVEEVERWLRRTRPDRHRRRPLLGHGPRPPLGPDQEGLRRDRAREGAAGGVGRRGGPGLLRARTSPTSSSSRP